MAPTGPTPLPDLSLERAFATEYGVTHVAGVDEAGRGALAGPVFAAAVVLSLDNQTLERFKDVRDSKLLAPATRERLFALICENITTYAVGSCPADYIDKQGILSATRQAMTAAIVNLPVAIDAIMVDGPLKLVNVNKPQRPVVRGDRLSLSIAAASILAKVSRDRYMLALDEMYPEYGFRRHKGYGTAEHLAALGRHGPCIEHRRSFAPLRTGLF